MQAQSCTFNCAVTTARDWLSELVQLWVDAHLCESLVMTRCYIEERNVRSSYCRGYS
jgi:hypothetical protein